MSHSDQPTPVSVPMQDFAAYIAGALKRKLPGEVAERAKLHLIDTFAAMVSGSRMNPGKLGIAHAMTLGGTREAGVVGTRFTTSAINAAFANGMSGHADETDDTHPPTRTHPGCSIVPATLAMAERQQASGAALLRAMVLGYDVCARVMFVLDNLHMLRTGHHPAGRGGLFGCTAATAALLRLNAEKVRYALSYAAQQSAGVFSVLRDPTHVEKSFVGGASPAQHGVATVLMVKNGFTGLGDAFSGENNFLTVYAPQGDIAELTRGLGSDYAVMNGGIKFWPVGGPIQAPLHVLRGLMREHGFTAANVASLDVRMPDNELKIVNNRHASDICVQHLLSVMLLDGNVTFKSAHNQKRMQDPKVLALRRDCVHAIPDPSLSDPARSWRCIMQVKLKDGRTLDGQTLAAPGGVGNPLPRPDVEEKAMDLMVPVLGRQRSLKLIAALSAVERIKDARELRRLYAV